MKAVSYKLTDLLDEVKSGAYLIPRFQRKYVWAPEQACQLIDSLARNYPIGALLTLPSESLQLAATPLDTKSDFVAKEVQSQLYVLDGQQRLTSITRAMLGEDPKQVYFFDLSVMYDELVEFSGADLDWVSFTNRTKKNKVFDSHQLPCEAVLNPATSAAKVHTYLSEVKRIPYEQLFEVAAKITSVFETIRNYQVVSHLLEKKESLEAICRIFETINNTGVKLDTFDLVVAKNYSATFDLRELVERAESATPDCAKLNPDPELYLHSLNYYLQYQTGKRFDLTRAGLLNLHRDALGQHLQSVITAYGEVHNWLVDQSFKVNKGRPLVPNMMLSSIAAAEMCHPGALRTPELRSVLTAWALATLWNDSTYNKVRALPELPRLMELFSAKSPTFGLLSATAQATPITVQDLIEMGPSSKKYQIAHAIMKMKQRTDLLGEVIQSAEELEDHHILPKSICLKRGISLELVNCIGNRVLVSSNTNKKVASDYMPNDYYDFAKQFVPEYTLRQGFEAAFIDRTMRETAYNVNSDALFTEWMTPRLEKIAGALNEYFGLFYTTTA